MIRLAGLKNSLNIQLPSGRLIFVWGSLKSTPCTGSRIAVSELGYPSPRCAFFGRTKHVEHASHHLFALPWVPPRNLVAEHGRVGLRSALEFSLVHHELTHIRQASRFRHHLYVEKDSQPRLLYRTSSTFNVNGLTQGSCGTLSEARSGTLYCQRTTSTINELAQKKTRM